MEGSEYPLLGGLVRGLRDEAGEELVARELQKRVAKGVMLLHDRRLPGSRGNVDHIAVTRSGVWVIDAKRYNGRVAVSKPLFREAKLTVAGRDRTDLVRGLARQVDGVRLMLADLNMKVPVHGALCFVDARLPLLHAQTMNGLLIAGPRRIARRLNARGSALVAGEVPGVASALAARLPLA